MAKEKRNTAGAVRWAMSPVPFRRRAVSQSTLFPAGFEGFSPKHWTSCDPAPAATGPRDSSPGCPTADCPPPFPIGQGAPRLGERTLGSAAKLVGIARLAANSPAAETQRNSPDRPEYFLLPVRSILNRCDSQRVPFEWTINPYRGCEFACKYCYARYTHEYMELDGAEFEKKIYVKKDAAPLLAQDVSRKYSYASEASGGSRPDHIAIGTATELTEAGLAVCVSASPLIPGITDREGDLEALAAAGREAGAQWFFSAVLFLMPSSAKQFFPFLRVKFPRLVQQYEKWFGKNGYAPEEYRRKIAERVGKSRATYSFR